MTPQDPLTRFVDAIWRAGPTADDWGDVFVVALQASGAAVEFASWRADNLAADAALESGEMTQEDALQLRYTSEAALNIALALYGLPDLKTLLDASRLAWDHRGDPRAAAEIAQLEVDYLRSP